MKFQKFALIAILVALTFVVFSGCSSDHDRYRWRETSLTATVELPVDRNGYIYQTFRIQADRNINNFNPGREDIADIRYYNSWLIIYNLVPRDRMDLIIILDKNTIYEHRYTITADINGEYVIEDRDPNGFDGFMRELTHRVARYGYVDVTIDSESNIVDGGPVGFEFEANIDIYVRN